MKSKSLPLLLLAAALGLGSPSFAQPWQHVGTPGFSSGGVERTSLAIGANDMPIVAFRDNSASGNGKLTVMKYSSGSWSNMGTNISTNAVWEVSLATDSATGTPYVAYVDSVLSVCVVKYNGSSWTAVGSAGITTNNQADLVKMLVAGDGTPYIGFRDGNQSYLSNMMKYSGGSWSLVGTGNFSSVAAGAASFAIDHNGTPYAASAGSGFPETIQLQKFNGSNWITVGAMDFDTSSFATNISLAIAPNNQPYVGLTYHDGSYQVKAWTYNGSSWLRVGGDVTTTDAEEVNIVVSKQGVPLVSYSDYDNLTYKITVSKFIGGVWSALGNTNFTAARADYSSLAVNSVGDVFVAYEDYGNAYGATVDEYLHNVGIHEANGLTAFNLYPNPNTGKFQISFKAAQAGDVQLSVTNMMGQQVWQDTRSASNGTESIDLSSVAKGLYTLQVKTTAGAENRLVEIK